MIIDSTPTQEITLKISSKLIQDIESFQQLMTRKQSRDVSFNEAAQNLLGFGLSISHLASKVSSYIGF